MLVLSWDPRGAHGGPTPQAAGLARTLAASEDEVTLVTRAVDDAGSPQVDGVEVHAVADAPPIIPAQLDEARMAAEAFAARAMAVTVRRLAEDPVDLVHAVGWQTGPVVAGLRTTHDVPVVATLGAADLDAGRVGRLAAATAARLAGDADVVVTATDHDAAALRAATAQPVAVVPPGVELPPRSPGTPPARGPLHLVAPPGAQHRGVAAAVRAATQHPRRITRSWRRRPFAVAVLDPADVDAAVRALALGVPLLAVDGSVGELATRTGGGLVVAPTGAAVGAAVDRLAADPRLAAALGEVGAAAAVAHGWPRVADGWRATVGRHLPLGAPRLHTAG